MRRLHVAAYGKFVGAKSRGIVIYAFDVYFWTFRSGSSDRPEESSEKWSGRNSKRVFDTGKLFAIVNYKRRQCI